MTKQLDVDIFRCPKCHTFNPVSDIYNNIRKNGKKYVAQCKECFTPLEELNKYYQYELEVLHDNKKHTLRLFTEVYDKIIQDRNLTLDRWDMKLLREALDSKIIHTGSDTPNQKEKIESYQELKKKLNKFYELEVKNYGKSRN